MANRNLSVHSATARPAGPSSRPPASSTMRQRLSRMPSNSGAITSVASQVLESRRKWLNSSGGDSTGVVLARANGIRPRRASQVVSTSTPAMRDRSSTIAHSIARPSIAREPATVSDGQPPPHTYSETKIRNHFSVRFTEGSGGRDLELQVFHRFGRRQNVTHVERTELGVIGRRFVEPHCVHDFLQESRLPSPERDPPLPVVEPRRSGNYLRNPAGELHAALAVFGHHIHPPAEGLRVPVRQWVADLIHRIETDDRPGGKIGKQTLLAHHHFPLLIRFEFGRESRAGRICSLGLQAFAILFDGRDVFRYLGD